MCAYFNRRARRPAAAPSSAPAKVGNSWDFEPPLGSEVKRAAERLDLVKKHVTLLGLDAYKNEYNTNRWNGDYLGKGVTELLQNGLPFVHSVLEYHAAHGTAAHRHIPIAVIKNVSMVVRAVLQELDDAQPAQVVQGHDELDRELEALVAPEPEVASEPEVVPEPEPDSPDLGSTVRDNGSTWVYIIRLQDASNF